MTLEIPIVYDDGGENEVDWEYVKQGIEEGWLENTGHHRSFRYGQNVIIYRFMLRE